MTVVGKILAFVNLVFSFVVGRLVMVVYMTHANWEDQFKKLQAEYVVVVADRQQTVKDKQAVQTELTKREQDEQNALRTLAKNNEKDFQDLQKLKVGEYIRQAAEAREKAERERDAAKADLATIQQGG